MTFLSFSIDGRRFALPAADIISVVPAAPLRGIDGAPSWVAGILDYFGDMVPVIDLCALQVARPCRPAFGTRIVIVRYPVRAGVSRPLGLRAEGVTEVLDLEQDQWRETGLATPETPWLGPLAQARAGTVQRITVADLLPDEVRQRLFP
jgi:chemotaxis-related protein WspB